MIVALAAIVLARAPGAPPDAGEDRDVVIVGAGDIAQCDELSGAEATAKLLDAIPGLVFTLGDHAHPNGGAEEFANCYDPTWGRHKERTRPSPGNHDYDTPGAVGYFGYWGQSAGDPGKGYYSYDAGAWHVVVLNSNCAHVGCEAGSPQELWLREDLKAHPASCTLAYWHHPLFSSGIKPSHALHPEMRPIWQALYEAGADLVLNGHEHNYERFAPQDPDGRPDATRGIREIVAGVGGRRLHELPVAVSNSEIHSDDTFGVLKLTLHSRGYDWEFVPVAGSSFKDSGSGTCHGPVEAVSRTSP